MKLTKMSVELWLEDLAARTNGRYEKSHENSLFIIYTVTNYRGTLKIIQSRTTKKWFKGSDELQDSYEFVKAIQVLEPN